MPDSAEPKACGIITFNDQWCSSVAAAGTILFSLDVYELGSNPTVETQTSFLDICNHYCRIAPCLMF